MRRDFFTETYLMVLSIAILFFIDAIMRKVVSARYTAFEEQENSTFGLTTCHYIFIFGLITTLFFEFRMLIFVFIGTFGLLSILSYRRDKNSLEYIILAADGVFLTFCTIATGLSLI